MERERDNIKEKGKLSSAGAPQLPSGKQKGE